MADSGSSYILVDSEFGDAGFCGGRKTGEPGKNPWRRVRTNNKLNPHRTPGWNQMQGTLVEGE